MVYSSSPSKVKFMNSWHTAYNIRGSFCSANLLSHSATVFLCMPKILAVALNPISSLHTRNTLATLLNGVLTCAIGVLSRKNYGCNLGIGAFVCYHYVLFRSGLLSLFPSFHNLDTFLIGLVLPSLYSKLKTLILLVFIILKAQYHHLQA